MKLKDQSEYYERNSLTEKIECIEKVDSLNDLNFEKIENIDFNEYQISELIVQARIKLKNFFSLKYISEIIPDNSKIIAVSSNIPLVIAICFLLEDKKKSIIVYNEKEDNLAGSFTCNDVIMIFFIIYLLVNDKKNGELPFSSMEELSMCSIKYWMNEILNLKDCSSKLILDVNCTLLDGANACLDLDRSKKILKVQNKEFIWREFGCWIVEKNVGLHPICYFSPLTVLSSLVQHLQICTEDCDLDIQNFVELDLESNCELECNATVEESIIGSFFHKKVKSQLNIVNNKNKKCLKTSSSLLSAMELFLVEGQTHIPIVSDENEIFTGKILTIEKCCIYFAKSIVSQEKVNLEDPLETLFFSKNFESSNNSSPFNKINQNIMGNNALVYNSNCKDECFEYNLNNEFDDENKLSNIIDICLSGAISHILLSEDQCIVLTDQESSKVTAILTAQDICKFLLGT